MPMVPRWMLEGSMGRSLERRLSDENYDFGSAAKVDVPTFIRDAPLGDLPQATPEVTRSFRQTLQLLTSRYLQNTFWALGHTIEQFCQSPSQAMMLMGLASIGVDEVIVGGHGGAEELLSPRPPGGDSMIITPKTGLDGYRAVLLVEIRRVVPNLEVRTKTKEGVEIPGSKKETARVLVECADAPPDQISLGESGDHLLSDLGFPVMRFTEDTVWADPIACALKVFGLLQQPPREVSRR